MYESPYILSYFLSFPQREPLTDGECIPYPDSRTGKNALSNCSGTVCDLEQETGKEEVAPGWPVLLAGWIFFGYLAKAL